MPGVGSAVVGQATVVSGPVGLSAAPWGSDMGGRTRKAGRLRVARAGEGEATGYRMALPAYPPARKAMPDSAAAMGGEPVETLWHAGGYVLNVHADATSVRALEPDLRDRKSTRLNSSH